MLTVFVSSLLASLGGCQCTPPVWEGPPLSLPQAEHAYAVPVRAASMARILPQEKLDELIATHCVFEPEMEPPIDEEEIFLEKEPIVEVAQTPDPPPVDQAMLANEIAQGSLSEALSEVAEPGEIEALGQEFSASLGERLPTALVAPAILTITLEEIRWLGNPVVSLQEGRLYPASKENLSIPRLYEALDESVKHTLDVAEACRKIWDGSALLAIDARVPLSTVYPVMYTMGQARFSTFLFMVNDPDPVETRSQEPAGGLTGSGTLTVNTQEYEWQRLEDTGFGVQDKRSVETQTWATDAPWPSVLDPALPPKAVIDFELNQLFNTLMAAYDRLAEHKVFCAVAAFPEEQTSLPVIPLTHLPPPSPLTIDPQGTVAVHVNQIPMIGGPYGDGYHDDLIIMRGDGSKCSIYEMRLGTRADLPTEPTPSLSDFFNNLSELNPSMSNLLDATLSTPNHNSATPTSPPFTAHLKAVRLPENDSGNPRTRVSAGWTEPGKMTQYKEVAVVNEPCSSPGSDTEGLDELLCWWAGAGTTFILHQAGDSLVVESGRVYEEDPDEPTSEEVTRIPLPPGTTVVPKP